MKSRTGSTNGKKNGRRRILSRSRCMVLRAGISQSPKEARSVTRASVPSRLRRARDVPQAARRAVAVQPAPGRAATRRRLRHAGAVDARASRRRLVGRNTRAARQHESATFRAPVQAASRHDAGGLCTPDSRRGGAPSDRNGGARVKHVARSSGFTDDQHMRRAYKRLLGVTPAEYRSRFH
jgi:AraC-like DNA-binding protein